MINAAQRIYNLTHELCHIRSSPYNKALLTKVHKTYAVMGNYASMKAFWIHLLVR